MSRSGIVNVRMVITEEKILSNIDKVQRMINPKSKKQIIQLEDDSYFKDLIESIKTYLVEYPKKKNFPSSVYKAAYELVEFATNQFEENTKQIEELIRQREANITSARILKETLEIVENKVDGWKGSVKEIEDRFPEDIIETLQMIVKSKDIQTENYQDAVKLINARVLNLESNLHIEIDMERIEDRSKALSYIGIEVADALKLIPTPEDINVAEIQTQTANTQVGQTVTPIQTTTTTVQSGTDSVTNEYVEQTTFEVKPSLWQRFKQTKFARAISYALKIRVVLDLPTLPEGRESQN